MTTPLYSAAAYSAVVDATRDAFVTLKISHTPYVPKAIVLYSGTGAHPDCVRATKAALARFLQTDIVLGDEVYFQKEGWIQKTRLVVMPGGVSTGKIMLALGAQGLVNIK